MSRIKFPTALRKMWSGGEVQGWLDRNVRPQLDEQFAAAVEEVLAVERQVRINQKAEIEALKKTLEQVRAAWGETQRIRDKLLDDNAKLANRIAALRRVAKLDEKGITDV